MARKPGLRVRPRPRSRPSAEPRSAIPAAVATGYQVLPLAEGENGLVVAVEDPTNMERMEEVRFVAGTKLIPVVAPPHEIPQALELSYGPVEPEPSARRPPDDIDIRALTQRLAVRC